MFNEEKELQSVILIILDIQNRRFVIKKYWSDIECIENCKIKFNGYTYVFDYGYFIGKDRPFAVVSKIDDITKAKNEIVKNYIKYCNSKIKDNDYLSDFFKKQKLEIHSIKYN